MRATFDFETYNWVNSLCCGIYWRDLEENAVDGERFTFLHEQKKYSSDAEEYLDEWPSLNERVLLAMADIAVRYGVTQFWAHNMGKFDGLLLLQEGLSKQYKMIGVPAAGRLIRLDVYVPMASKDVRVRLLDSYAVVQSKLKDALESFQVKTKKVFQGEDYSNDMRQMPSNLLYEGNFADCKGLYELLDTVDAQVTGWGGTLKSTFSSCAISVVKSKLEDRRIAFPSHDGNQWANEIGRKAYYGGRVEVLNHSPWWIRPEKPLLTYDVNSSYPASMRGTLPWELYGKVKEPTEDILYDEQWEGLAFARVHVADDVRLPPLPYRPEEGGIFFPTGEWSAWFPLNELRYASGLGVEIEPLEVIVYTKAAPFTDFIDEVYQYKRTATGAARMFAKLMLNGCYGKFGMKPERDILRIFDSEEEGLGYAMETGAQKISESWRVLACKTFKWAPTTHYALASYITAGARIRLHSALSSAILPAYCDTDSVHCAQYKGPVSDLLGDLKLEGTYNHARYYAPKLYELHSEGDEPYYVSKGFPVNGEAFNAIIRGKEVKTGRMQLARSQLKKGGNAAYVEQLKRWTGRSMKRFAFQSGQTRPWSVEELSEGKHLTMQSPLFMPERE